MNEELKGLRSLLGEVQICMPFSEGAWAECSCVAHHPNKGSPLGRLELSGDHSLPRLQMPGWRSA